MPKYVMDLFEGLKPEVCTETMYVGRRREVRAAAGAETETSAFYLSRTDE